MFGFVGNTLEALFAEELGVVLEVAESNTEQVIRSYQEDGVACVPLGYSVGLVGPNAKVKKTCF